MDYSKYFKTKNDSVIFIGDKLEIYIPDRYHNHGYLDIGNTVKTIGIFDMVINDTIASGYLMGAVIEISPSDGVLVTVEGCKYLKLTLNKNDIFIVDVNIINDSKISYVMFYEMVYSGHYPVFLDYKNKATLFDNIGRATGDKFDTDHMIFEMIAATVHKDSKNIYSDYRHTDMKEDPIVIPLRNISMIAKSTTGKILGSYMKDGVDAAIVNASDNNSEIEDLLRE